MLGKTKGGGDMRKPAMLAALSLLLLALAACGAAEPAQTTDAAADTGTPEPVSWEGPGECYKAEPIETTEGAWPGCTQEYDGEICSLISTENGTLRVMRGSRSLLEPEGSRGYFMRCDENGCWLVTGGLEGVALRLYDFEGKKLLERALDEAPRSMLLAGGRAWLDFGDGIVVYGPDGSKEEIGPEGEYLGIVADRKGGVQLIRQKGEKLRITPIEGGEGFLTENGVLGCGAGSAFLYLAAADGLYTISDSGKARLLIDFAACKMEFFGMSAVSSLDDGRFMCTTKSGEVLLRPATPYELRDRTVLKVAVFNAYGVKELAAQFNAQSPDYELELVDYVSETGSVDQALTRMSAELGAGIFAGSEQKEGCWEFIRFTLMDPTANMHIGSRPLYRPLFDEMLEANVGDYPNQISIEEAAELRELVERADKLAIYDDSAMDIILEEAGAYFSGAQSAWQAAEYVQNRMSIYVAEQS